MDRITIEVSVLRRQMKMTRDIKILICGMLIGAGVTLIAHSLLMLIIDILLN